MDAIQRLYTNSIVPCTLDTVTMTRSKTNPPARLERGEKNVSLDSMEKLASALERTVPELLVTPTQGKADLDRLFKRWQSR
jgi:hypothetical protein